MTGGEKMATDIKRLNVALDPELHKRFKTYAARSGRTMSECIKDLISKELKKQEIKNEQ